MKNKKSLIKIKVLALLSVLAMMAFIVPEYDVLEQINKNLEKWRTSYSPEKVYLHHDKPYYTPGQHLWLKGYVVNASSLQPSMKSNVLYVDLLNVKHEPVQQLTLKVENGRTHGDMALPDNLPGGMYRLVAHTQWMRNFGEETFFNKEIQIIGGVDSSTTSLSSLTGIDLQFFPEGGYMVNGLSSRIAFKAVDANGRGVQIHGSIFDDQGHKIISFKDHHLGMGAFTMQPTEGHSYFAKVNFKDGTTIDYPLPEALQEGYVLSINETDDQDYIDVKIRGNFASDNSLILTAISRDEVRFSKTFTLKGAQEYSERIAKKLFSSGIVRFNLASDTGEPLSERLAFVHRKDNLNIAIKTDKLTYLAREQVTMKIEVKDEEGKPVATDLSLAITDDDLVKPIHHGLSIQSYLLLNSDIHGYVEQPGYYFENDNPERAEALSYLLMSQGWRRFTWRDARTGTFPVINYMNEASLAMKGKLVTNKGEPVKKGEVILYLKDQHESFIITETNEQGVFYFDGFDFRDSIDMVVQGTDAKGRRKHLEVKMDESRFMPDPPAYNFPAPLNLSASTGKDYLTVSHKQIAYADQVINAQTLKAIMLKDVIIEGRAEIIDTYTLHNRADAVLTSADLPLAPSGNILESLQGRVAGLQVVRTGPNDFSARIRGQGPPLYLLDGIPVSESSLITINQFDIGRIEILKSQASAAIYGGRAAYGVIAFYSRTGAEQHYVETRPGRYIIVHRAGGYSKVREFYSPHYGDSAPGHELPDLRTTLYWNPEIKTDEKGQATITFYTADRSAAYRAIAEGISNEGIPGRKEMIFKTQFEEVSP